MCGRYYSLFDKQQIAEHFHLRSTADNVGIIAAIQIPKSKLTETCLYVPRIEHILVTMGTMARTPTPIPFTPPMECLPVARIPEGDTWIYELKLDGYRAQAIRDIKWVRLLSRNGKDLTKNYPLVLRDVREPIAPDTALDGELVAFDDAANLSFNALQNATPETSVVFFAFDVLVSQGKDVKIRPLRGRKEILSRVLSPNDLVQRAEHFNGPWINSWKP